jgi:hypothetical protein
MGRANSCESWRTTTSVCLKIWTRHDKIVCRVQSMNADCFCVGICFDSEL